MNYLPFLFSQDYVNYQELVKPFWAPPSWIFGPVWSVLYLIIFISFGFIFYEYFKKRVSFVFVLPFILNLIFNFLFSPIQFGLKNLDLASVDIILVLITIIWIIKISYKKYRWVALAQIPYLMWVSFATVLQVTINILN